MARELATAAISLSRQQRWRFLESAVLWEGSVKRSRVAQAFDVAMNYVTKDIAAYEDRYPRNIEYDHRRKAYVAGSRFKPALATGDPAEYLALIQAYAETSSEAIRPTITPGLVDADVIPQPGKDVPRKTLQNVIQAIQRKHALQIDYASLTSDKAAVRTVWPHAIAFDGRRWHMRAMESGSPSPLFRDFTLRRIERCEVIPGSEPPIGSEKDVEWHRTVVAEVIPNPSLPEHKKRALARDYSMRPEGDTFVWRQSLRVALVPYFAAFYGLDAAPDTKPRPRLMLRNYDTLQSHLFPPDRD